MRVPKQLMLVGFFTLSFAWAHANTGNDPKDDKKGEPSISGYVSDADSKKPVQGVTVSISGKSLDKKEMLTTDASGNFKSQLATGEVTIILEKKGYRTYRKEGVVIKEGTTLKINLDIEEDDDNAGVSHPLLRMIDGE